MFWRFGGYANISTIDTILEKPDVTLEELLDESDLIQELKQQNSKLVEFLREEARLKRLLEYVTAEKPLESSKPPKEAESRESDGKDKSTGISFFGRADARSRSRSVRETDESEQEKQEARRKKYAYVACEILSSDVWSITEAVLEHQAYLKEFWQYVYTPTPLDALQAGYFTKVNESLLDKKTAEMLSFFKSLDGIVPAMLQHVDCPTIMDLLLKIISLEKHEGGAGIVDWLQTQDLIPLLLAYLSPDHSSATQTSAGDFLKAIITISANATAQDQSVIGPNELTRQLVSGECIEQLINDMLRGGNPLTVGVGIIIEVIRKNNSDYDLDNQIGPVPKASDPIYLGTLLRHFADHVADFMHLIRAPASKKAGLKAAFGTSIEPLGFDRFKTCELMAELLHCSNMGLLNEAGAEEDVRQRDAERNRLRAEGKLQPARAADVLTQDNSHEEFGSSVDSHGFHHAEKPDIADGSDDQKLDEDGFEKVSAPPNTDDLPDEVNFDDLNEKEKQPAQVTTPQMLHFDPPPTQAVDSPTTSEVTGRLNDLGVEDTVMTELGEEQPLRYDEDADTARDYGNIDRPAPLFAKKSAESAQPSELASESSTQDISQSVATLQPETSTIQSADKSGFQLEADGNPVVGDLLKIRFSEQQVVPTILDFFFRFPWNNFLHNVVYDVVQQVFNGALERGYNRTLAFDLFAPVQPKDDQDPQSLGLISLKDITDRILDGQQASDKSQQERNMRLGYMGHLTLIAEEVCKFGTRFDADTIDPVIAERVRRDAWTQYVDGTLAETRDKDNAVLGGVRPENAMIRPGGNGLQSSFSSNTSNALANAGIGTNISEQDSIAMSEGTVGESFEVGGTSMLSHFGDDDDEMEDPDGHREQDRRGSGGSHFSEDEQVGELSFDDVDMDYR